MICKACGQMVPEKGKRMCSLCGRGIARSERWQFGPDGRAQHKCCPAATHEPTPPAPAHTPQLSFLEEATC